MVGLSRFLSRLLAALRDRNTQLSRSGANGTRAVRPCGPAGPSPALLGSSKPGSKRVKRLALSNARATTDRHWKGSLSVQLVADFSVFTRQSMPPQLKQALLLP